VRSIGGVNTSETTPAVQQLVAAVEAALATDPEAGDERALTESFRPAMAALLDDPEPVPAWTETSLDGDAVGNLLHADPEGRFHILAVVFPEGTSSGVHHHGCWGLIGYLRGGDEETRYRARSDTGDHAELEEVSRHVWHRGDITALLPGPHRGEAGDEGWHRVRNPGPGDGVSIHVLCRSPAEHPHRFHHRDGTVVPFPFVEVAPGRWSAQLPG
jgi:3-mercaptopropionate dioxygenase